MNPKYNFNDKNEFVIENYDKAKTFASFLPGIAGVDGIPMWSFYVNRGQVMGSFGVKDRNSTIMEFFPANVMCKNIEREGFRTFIKYKGVIHEIFSSVSIDENTRTLVIEKNNIKIIEENLNLGLKITVTYFTMPGENYAAVVRKVEVENLNGEIKEIEILDGLPQIFPFGVTNSDYQGMSNLMKAWFDVFNMEHDIAYYKLRASTGDTVEVNEFEAGNFYLSFSSESKGLITPIFDMNIIFGENTALSKADGWDCSIDELYKRKQIPENKVSGGFTGVRTTIGENKFILCSVIGHIASIDLINDIKDQFTIDYICNKEAQAAELVNSLVQDTYTNTSSNLFDKYIDQCYLDNLLRGGHPLTFKAGNKNHVYHVFSRKHGDLEREYNFFSLEPAFYSQGNGNFRDVSQNRRNDVLIKPEVKDFNVRHFMSLIQLDGYNPLSVKGCTFSFNQRAWKELEELLASHQEEIQKLLQKKYTPGQLISYIVKNKTVLKLSKEAFLEKVLENSSQNFEAEFGEGYWSDHWTYNMDLVDTYITIYPDMMESFLFEDQTYRYFYSPVYVLPRIDKYVLANGKVRQYGAILEAPEKVSKETSQENCWLRTKNGEGEIYETNLYAKLISLALIKFTSLDPKGMGIEIEAGKPGWNDALNGLSGLFGSSICETAELLRIVEFVIQKSSKYDRSVILPVELGELLKTTEELLDKNLLGGLSDFNYWDLTTTAKEAYRKEIRYGISGNELTFTSKEILNIFNKLSKKIHQGTEKALGYGSGIYPTYFTYAANKYEILEGKTNPVNGYQNVKITDFECSPLPLFLEGPARVLKTIKDKTKALELYEAVKASGIYDSKLKMYKTSASLEKTSTEIGRLKAFTPGWLERESVFLHMEYKYLYALLQIGLYDEFFSDIKTMLVPFMKPEIYGRSTLENSSFIASSVNPDESLHGRGFVARMSGSTAEMLSMWFLMMAGKDIFSFENNELQLKLKPVLPCWLFDEQGIISFKFLGSTLVNYINPKKQDTFGSNGVKPYKYKLIDCQGQIFEIKASFISGQYALKVRNGEIRSVDVYLE